MQPITSENIGQGSAERYFDRRSYLRPSAAKSARSADRRYQNLWAAVAAETPLRWHRVWFPAVAAVAADSSDWGRAAAGSGREVALAARASVASEEGRDVFPGDVGAAGAVRESDCGGRSHQAVEYSGYTWRITCFSEFDCSGTHEGTGHSGHFCGAHGFFQFADSLPT